MFLEHLKIKQESSETKIFLKTQGKQIQALLDLLDFATDETIGWERSVQN
jgi:hypothetical protein